MSEAYGCGMPVIPRRPVPVIVSPTAMATAPYAYRTTRVSMRGDTRSRMTVWGSLCMLQSLEGGHRTTHPPVGGNLVRGPWCLVPGPGSQNLHDVRADVAYLLRRERGAERRHAVAAVAHRSKRDGKVGDACERRAHTVATLAILAVADDT